MKTEHEASRRLVKSPPELWAECSNPDSLARHLGEFGEISITRLEPESTVAWEGERASGTVRIEPSGWGTRVTLTALTAAVAVPAAADATAPVDEVPERDVPEPDVFDEVLEPEPVEEESDATTQKTLEEPDPLVAHEAPALRSRWRRLRIRMRRLISGPEPQMTAGLEPLASEGRHDAASEPEALTALPEAPAAPEIVSGEEEEAPPPDLDLDPEAILVAALDSLGQAHHRPFSRA